MHTAGLPAHCVTEQLYSILTYELRRRIAYSMRGTHGSYTGISQKWGAIAITRAAQKKSKSAAHGRPRETPA